MYLKTILYTSIILCAISSCKSNNDQSNDEDIPVLPIVQPHNTDTTVEQKFTVNIQAIKNVEIRSRVRSIIDQSFVDEGAQVKQGQNLFKLNSQEFEIIVAQAKASLESAQADAQAAKVERDRVQNLVKKNVVSPSELALAEQKLQAMLARINEAKAVLKNADNHVNYTLIKAPFNGVIDRLPLKTGSLIDEGALLTNISDLSQVYAYFEIPETEYISHVKSLQEGSKIWQDSAELILSDGSLYPLKGAIQNSESIIDPSTGSIAFRGVFRNPYKILRHNSSGTIVLYKHVSNVLAIPQRAVFQIQDKSYVYLVDKTNHVHLKEFNPGISMGTQIAIEDGLTKDDRIVYEGIQSLRDGIKIDIRK